MTPIPPLPFPPLYFVLKSMPLVDYFEFAYQLPTTIMEQLHHSRTNSDQAVLLSTIPIPDISSEDIEHNSVLLLMFDDSPNAIQIARHHVLVDTKTKLLELRKRSYSFYAVSEVWRDFVGFYRRSFHISIEDRIWKPKPTKVSPATRRHESHKELQVAPRSATTEKESIGTVEDSRSLLMCCLVDKEQITVHKRWLVGLPAVVAVYECDIVRFEFFIILVEFCQFCHFIRFDGYIAGIDETQAIDIVADLGVEIAGTEVRLGRCTSFMGALRMRANRHGDCSKGSQGKRCESLGVLSWVVKEVASVLTRERQAFRVSKCRYVMCRLLDLFLSELS